ncbi:hypothetical protein B0H14DRAFT_2597142 [Mycena olivaceomarginata]|nr:hypothetical protein B0H14DRAFT_2597142 [Mycena olivaceomarginata]
MSVRTVGIARAPAGLSSAEFNARVQGVADTLLALPIAASAITKHELLVPNHDLDAKLQGLGVGAASGGIIVITHYASQEKLLEFVADAAVQKIIAEAKAQGDADSFLFTVDTVTKK